MEKVPWVKEIPQLTWERSEGFRDLLDPSVRQAQTDSVPERFEHLDGQLKRGVHDSNEVHSILGREKHVISESEVLASEINTSEPMIQGSWQVCQGVVHSRVLKWSTKCHGLHK